MTLGEKQRKFTLAIGELIKTAYDMGYELSFSYALRCPDCPIGKKTSLHKISLAVDFNLFKNGAYLDKTEDHLPIGEAWERLGGSWGGRFGDGNHYSFEHNGMK
jgi:hypothetical protein